MWVLKRTSDGLYVAKAGLHNSYTTSLRLAEKFDNREAAVAKSCVENETPVQINPYDYFTK